MVATRGRRGFAGLWQDWMELRQDYDYMRKSDYDRKRTGVSSVPRRADYHYSRTQHFFYGMEVARDIERSDEFVGQGIERLIANVIQGGFLPDPCTGDDKVDARLSELWEEWSSDADLCDVSEELTFHDMEEMVLRRCVVDGDIVALPVDSEDSLELVEAHRLRTPTNTSIKNILHGVRRDDRNRRTEYWLTKEDVGPLQKLERVGDIDKRAAKDADGNRSVFHIRLNKRVHQSRGVSALAPITSTTGMTSDLMFAKLVQAKVTSCFAIIHQRDVDGPGLPEDGVEGEVTVETRRDGTEKTLSGIGPGAEYWADLGEKLEGFSPNVPNTEFFKHASLLLNVIAVNLSLPLAVLMLDPSQTNFSGWRGAMDQAKMQFRRFQKWLVKSFHKHVWEWRVRRWLQQDDKLQALVEAAAMEAKQVAKCNWKLPGWPYIEPLKDAMAYEVKRSGLQCSQTEMQAELGRDFAEVAKKAVSENGSTIRLAMNEADAINKEFAGRHTIDWRECLVLPLDVKMSAKIAVGDSDAGDGAGTGKNKDGQGKDAENAR